MENICPICSKQTEFLIQDDRFKFFCEECHSYIQYYDFTGNYPNLLLLLKTFITDTFGDAISIFMSNNLEDFPTRITGGEFEFDEFGLLFFYDYGIYGDYDYIEIRNYVESILDDYIIDASGEGFYVIKGFDDSLV